VRDGELLVRLRVHEVHVGAVVVEVLDVLRLGVHARELLPRAERAVDDRPRVEALQLRADERAALAGFTCWNSTIRHTLPSSSMCIPFLKLFVSTVSATAAMVAG
jgi:hypothetical protein